MSANGFKLKNGTIVKYDFDHLDNIPPLMHGMSTPWVTDANAVTRLGNSSLLNMPENSIYYFNHVTSSVISDMPESEVTGVVYCISPWPELVNGSKCLWGKTLFVTNKDSYWMRSCINNNPNTGDPIPSWGSWHKVILDSDLPYLDVTYGTTTSAEIEAAYQANKKVWCTYGNKVYPLTYRESATIHHFVMFHNQARYALKCDNNTWSDSTSTFAKKDSAQLTGTPTAPTAAAGTNTTQLATTAFVQTAVGGAIPLPQSASDGQFLTYNGTSDAWVATTVPSANGVSF